MSAPLVVNTTDGTCWTRRLVTRDGLALYAPADVCKCPSFVMATLPELAEHGIVGSADVLPVPVGPEPQAPTEAFVPRTERSYWVAIADALNAAHSAGMPVGIDLDGTLTDHNAWSVVWDRTAERWTVDGYEDDVAPGPSERPVNALTAMFAPTQALREDVYESPLHHDYRVSHDRPETGGEGRG